MKMTQVPAVAGRGSGLARLPFVCPILLLLAILPGCGGGQVVEWRTYSAPDGTFSIEMPEPITVMEKTPVSLFLDPFRENLEIQKKEEFQSVSSTLAAENAQFSVWYNYENRGRPQVAVNFLLWLCRSRCILGDRVGSSWSETEIKLDDVTSGTDAPGPFGGPFEVQMAIAHSDDVLISRGYSVWVSAGKRLAPDRSVLRVNGACYLVSVVVPKEHASSPNVRRFFDSFRILIKEEWKP
jgi:hypothetical protein